MRSILTLLIIGLFFQSVIAQTFYDDGNVKISATKYIGTPSECSNLKWNLVKVETIITNNSRNTIEIIQFNCNFPVSISPRYGLNPCKIGDPSPGNNNISHGNLTTLYLKPYSSSNVLSMYAWLTKTQFELVWDFRYNTIKGDNSDPTKSQTKTEQKINSQPGSKSGNSRYYIEAGQLVIDNGDTRELILISKMTPEEIRNYEKISGLKLSTSSTTTENKINKPEKENITLVNKEEDQQAKNTQKLQDLRNEFEQRQLQMEKDQIELNNAGNAASNATLNSLNQGKKMSGALIDGALAGSGEISDLGSRRTFLGAMGGLALLNLIGEKKQAKLKKEQEEKKEQLQFEREQKRLQEIAEFQANYYSNIPRGQSLSMASLKGMDTIWAYFIAYPSTFNLGESFKILMSNPFKIGKYSDDSWPLISDLTKNIRTNLGQDKLDESWIVKLRCFYKTEEETYVDMITVQNDTYKLDGTVSTINYSLYKEKDHNNSKDGKKSFWDE